MPSNTRHQNNGQGSDRVAIFIDGSNLYHSLEENCKRVDLDFAAFTAKLCRGRPLFRTYYYNVLRDADRNPQAYRDQQKFLSALQNTPYLEVRLSGSKLRGDVAIEKGVDITLATDLLQYAWDNLYDVAVLVSGDGDFSYAVQAVKNMGKHVEVAAFPSNLSGELSQTADNRESFTSEFFEELWARRSRGGRSKVERSRGRDEEPQPSKVERSRGRDEEPQPKRGWWRGRHSRGGSVAQPDQLEG